MKKLLIPFLLVGLLASCKKDDGTTNATASGLGTWSTGSKTFKVKSLNKSNNTVTFYEDSLGGIAFSFFDGVKSGSHSVVAFAQAASEVDVVVFGKNNGTSYFSTGTDNVKATVSTTSDGKFKISLPSTRAVSRINNDSLLITAEVGPFQ